MPSRSTRRRYVAVAVAAGLTGLCGCGGSSDGPLMGLAQGGQPIVDAGGLPVTPGQSADFTAFVVNKTHTPVTLMSASVIPVGGSPGYPIGHLIHLAVSLDKSFPGADRGWPPSGGIKWEPLRGAKVGFGQADIIFGISGKALFRNYVVAGLRITYLFQGQSYSVTAWSVGVACVIPARLLKRRSHPSCTAITDRIQSKVDHMAGTS
jgi:hypothetical protein